MTEQSPAPDIRQLGANAARVAWYTGLNWLAHRRAARLQSPTRYQPTRPVPSRDDMLRDLRQLMVDDARAVSAGHAAPPDFDPTQLGAMMGRTRAAFRELEAASQRRDDAITDSVRGIQGAADLPDYYTQDFHFQPGGYLSEESARLYDVQVETLFHGAASLMRRAVLPAIAGFMRGRDQRQLHLLDIACGTGRLLREVRLAYPAMRLAGLDLSQTYLDEAHTHMGRLRPATWIAANAEAIPLADASQDIVTSVFLFHELPPDVRRIVAAEMARVLKPGGLLVFADSLQMGDKPGWDGLLEAFPVRFHEPYFRHYAIDDLDGMFADVGLTAEDTRLAFMTKVMVRRRVG